MRGGLVIDRERFRVLRDGEEVRLTPKEFELLMFLAQHPGRVLTHRTILKAIWGPNAVDQPEHLRVLVGSLRKKIEPNPSVAQVHPHRAVGRLPLRVSGARNELAGWLTPGPHQPRGRTSIALMPTNGSSTPPTP